jgi:trehalose 6-phosphate synthase
VSRRRLIVVSNRGPVSYLRDESGERVERRGAGGLVTALRGLLAEHDVTWIASAIGDEDRAVAAEGSAAAGVRLVRHDPAAYDHYYNVIANPLLWFTQHYLWGLGTAPSWDEARLAAWTDGYEPVNRAFADAVIEELDARPESAVFFHDYHLYLAPGLVRSVRPDAALSHFVHIPWPQADYWRVLPEHMRRAVHEGLLANDVVGFHTERWSRNFRLGCVDLLGAELAGDAVLHDGRRTVVTSRPVSIDPTEFDNLAAAAPDLELGGKIVLRVDRTDPSKNIVRGFRAFGLLLERYPQHRGGVSMLALLDPSRQDIPEYVDYLAELEAAARDVNERFENAIDLRVRDDFTHTVAAYKRFDVLFVNAVYDGLNLVAKEAPLVNRRDGVLVLSENAGAHEELGAWAVTVNPFDISGQADALHEALTMDASERAARAAKIRAHVREHDVAAWIAGQLEDLDRASLHS